MRGIIPIPISYFSTHIFMNFLITNLSICKITNNDLSYPLLHYLYIIKRKKKSLGVITLTLCLENLSPLNLNSSFPSPFNAEKAKSFRECKRMNLEGDVSMKEVDNYVSV